MRNKRKYNTRMNEYMKNRYRLRREKVLEQLGGCCVECKSTNNLELDHIDPKSKISTIAKLSSASEERFMIEVSKCQLLCKECHLKKSCNEGSFKNINRQIKCNCGKVFNTVKQYAGHRTWCKL